MTLNDVESLVYRAGQGWASRKNTVHFNGDVFCRGELFKVLRHSLVNPEASDVVDDQGRGFYGAQLQIFAIGEGGEHQSAPIHVQEPLLPLRPREQLNHFAGFILYRSAQAIDTKRLPAGSYVAQAQYESREGEETVEHTFHVLETAEYDGFWRALFGNSWDAPVYWDSMDAVQVAELVQEEPLGSLLEPASEETTYDAQSLYWLLGPAVTAYMVNDLGQLPFTMGYSRIAQPPSELPHIDLTKVMWLMRVLAPSWADAAFFSPRVELGYQVLLDGALEFTFRPVVNSGSLPPASAAYDVPRLDYLVQEAFGEEYRLETRWPVEGPKFSLIFGNK